MSFKCCGILKRVLIQQLSQIITADAGFIWDKAVMFKGPDKTDTFAQRMRLNSVVGSALWRGFHRMYFVLSSSSGASSCSASKKIPLHLWNPKIRLCLAYGVDTECCSCETS